MGNVIKLSGQWVCEVDYIDIATCGVDYCIFQDLVPVQFKYPITFEEDTEEKLCRMYLKEENHAKHILTMFDLFLHKVPLKSYKVHHNQEEELEKFRNWCYTYLNRFMFYEEPMFELSSIVMLAEEEDQAHFVLTWL